MRDLLLDAILVNTKLFLTKICQVSVLPIHDANRNRHERRIYSNYVAFANLLRLFGRYGTAAAPRLLQLAILAEAVGQRPEA